MPRSKGVYLPFQKARAIVLKLGLKSKEEWEEWSKSGERPTNIPSSPDQVYRDKGWVNTADWLGYDWKEEATTRGKRRRSDFEDEDEEEEEDTNTDDCTICLDPLDDTAHALHDNHRFCASCLDKWVSECAFRARSNRQGYLVTCPLCNKEVRCKRIRTG